MLNLMKQCLDNGPKIKVDLSVRVTHIRVPSTHSTVFSESTGPIELKFHIKNPHDRLAKHYTTCSGHMTKVAAVPIKGINPLNIFFWNQKANDLGTWYVAPYQVIWVDLGLF